MINYITGISDDAKRELAIDVDGKPSLGAIQFMSQTAAQAGDMADAELWNKALLAGAQKLNIPLK
jgi:hypothetical protein